MPQTYGKYHYTSDGGQVFAIRLDNHTVAAQPTAPVTGGSPLGSVSCWRNKRKEGIIARHAVLSRTISAGSGDGAVFKVLYRKFPLCSKTDLDGLGNAITINSVVWNVLRHVNEVAN